jgi:RNA polymerase sigma-70 factor (ECF subfamily)
LVRQFRRQRCPEAFRALYERYKDRVYGTAASITGDRTLAEDVAQEVFLRVHRKLPEFEERSSFSTWIYRMTVNLAADFRRGTTRRGRLTERLFERSRGGADALSECDATAERNEAARVVEAAIGRLSDKLAAAVVLRYLEGLSYHDVGEALGIDIGTVKSRLNRAHRELAADLQSGFADSRPTPTEAGALVRRAG